MGLLVSPMLMDPHPSQQHAVFTHLPRMKTINVHISYHKTRRKSSSKSRKIWPQPEVGQVLQGEDVSEVHEDGLN